MKYDVVLLRFKGGVLQIETLKPCLNYLDAVLYQGKAAKKLEHSRPRAGESLVVSLMEIEEHAYA